MSDSAVDAICVTVFVVVYMLVSAWASRDS